MNVKGQTMLRFAMFGLRAMGAIKIVGLEKSQNSVHVLKDILTIMFQHARSLHIFKYFLHIQLHTRSYC
jgi:hypothetical protein